MKKIIEYFINNPNLIGYILIALSIIYAACKLAHAIDVNFY